MFSITVVTQFFAGHLSDLDLAAISIATTVVIAITFGFPFQLTLQRFLQSQRKTGVIAWVSGGVFGLHVFVSWVFVYELRIGIVGTSLTIGFAWWLSVLGFFVYTVCGGCSETWTGFSAQAFVGLCDFFKLSLASGFMLLFENLYFRVLLIVSGFLNKHIHLFWKFFRSRKPSGVRGEGGAATVEGEEGDGGGGGGRPKK